jgi:hypothetical protein
MGGGAAGVVASADATGAAAGLRLAMTGFFFFFLGGATGTAWSSAYTGLGERRGDEPMPPNPPDSSDLSDTVCAWYPASVNAAESSGATWMDSSQGVRHAWPEETFTSAPGGSDSKRTVDVGGDELKKFRFGMDAEHAATLKQHARTAMTRLMIRIPPLGGANAAHPTTTIRACRDPQPKIPRPMGASGKVRPQVWRA